ncbi:MAG TPA: hypothetical protein DET40_08680 [Lentisphaeria bacterium]|nr:MAG: hypothetical protein A2X45_19355 [Lentisphaerae bacterium GWF2_50_93]HCE43610.1 hypothetical protein [Lentisphaeria bacterium]
MTESDKGVFKTVTRTLRKITFGAPTERVITEDCLVMMNVPSLMARRDSAYEWAACLLKNLLNLPREKRLELYNSVIDLLEASVDSGESIILIEQKSGKDALDFMNRYLVMLRDIVKAASALVNYETVFISSEIKKEGGSLLSESETRTVNENFRNSELSIFKSIINLIEINEPSIRTYREAHLKNISKESLLRYNKTYQEFEKIYKEYGKSIFPPKN